MHVYVCLDALYVHVGVLLTIAHLKNACLNYNVLTTCTYVSVRRCSAGDVVPRQNCIKTHKLIVQKVWSCMISDLKTGLVPTLPTHIIKMSDLITSMANRHAIRDKASLASTIT